MRQRHHADANRQFAWQLDCIQAGFWVTERSCSLCKLPDVYIGTSNWLCHPRNALYCSGQTTVVCLNYCETGLNWGGLGSQKILAGHRSHNIGRNYMDSTMWTYSSWRGGPSWIVRWRSASLHRASTTLSMGPTQWPYGSSIMVTGCATSEIRGATGVVPQLPVWIALHWRLDVLRHIRAARLQGCICISLFANRCPNPPMCCIGALELPTSTTLSMKCHYPPWLTSSACMSKLRIIATLIIFVALNRITTWPERGDFLMIPTPPSLESCVEAIIASTPSFDVFAKPFLAALKLLLWSPWCSLVPEACCSWRPHEECMNEECTDITSALHQ